MTIAANRFRAKKPGTRSQLWFVCGGTCVVVPARVMYAAACSSLADVFERFPSFTQTFCVREIEQLERLWRAAGDVFKYPATRGTKNPPSFHLPCSIGCISCRRGMS